MHHKLTIALLVLAAAIENVRSEAYCNDDPPNAESRLRNDLLCNYDDDYLPIKDRETHELFFTLIEMDFEYSDYDYVLHMASYIHMTWTDQHLKWDPKKYNGLEKLIVNSEDIWHPNFHLHDKLRSHVDSAELEQCPPSKCELEPVGIVTCWPKCKLSARCRGVFRYWPYDAQLCSIVFSHWFYKPSELNVTTYVTSYEGASQNGEWWMAGLHGRKTVANQTDLRFEYVIRRLGHIPAAMVFSSALALLIINVVTLWMSPDSTERLAMVCFSLFAHMMFVRTLSWYVPMNGDRAPLIFICYEISLWLTSALQVTAVLAQGLMQLPNRPPSWLESVSQLCVARQYFRSDYVLKSDNIDNRNNLWQPIVLCIDRIVFIIVGMVYTFVMIMLLIISQRWMTNIHDN